MTFELWLAFTLASTGLLLIPGPTVLLVLSYAVNQGKKTALASVFGVTVGDFVAMTASLVGLGALILASAALFNILKWMGALYLIYLGVQMLRKPAVAAVDGGTDTPPKKAFVQSVLVTALNPKSNIFFLAFVPQFVDTSSALFPQFAILIVTFVGLTILINAGYALCATQIRQYLTRPAAQKLMSQISGTTLIGMGVLTAAYKRTA